MTGVEAIEVFVAQQRCLLGRLEAFARTPEVARLQEVLRQGGAEGSETWLAAWLIQPASGIGQIPLALIEAGGIEQVETFLLRVLTNPSGC